MNIDDIGKNIAEAEQSVKDVWEIDGTTVYIRDLQIKDNGVIVDWFTFNDAIDKEELASKIEDLARKLIGEKECSTLSKFMTRLKKIFR